ncbi:MAG: reverse transcriptase family protein [Candidatus Thiodiazotropha endolucinida]|nr:reverse transcriptase family protein [Candidatus Thiodiazotropha endolucinida]
MPLHKKNDPLNKENFRPVSILPVASKAYERIMHNQLSSHFEYLFNPYLAAFRKGFGCQSTLLRLLEDWRRALDGHECAAAILMDLSKAFDCLPHCLLLEKLKAYGLSKEAVGLLESYLTDRKQQVKIGPHSSSWEKILKGVPQGSILGPLLFNIFLNDIFYFVTQANLYNYADDNTLSFIHKNFTVLKQVLEQDSLILIQWFTNNLMKANPSKFQAICVGKKAFENIKSFQIDSVTIECEENVTLLGVNIDFLLNFESHVSDICKKASKQLAVLKRIGRFLTKQGKLTIYNSFIASNFNYCPIVWHFCSAASTNKMEKIQERALRFIHNDFQSSTETLLALSKTVPLHIQRMKLMATEVYKIVNDLSPQYIRDLISTKVSHYDLRGEHKANLPQVSTTRYGLKSFRYEAARIWNSLPNNIRTAESFPQFKRLIRTWDGFNCRCTSCSV